MLIGPLKFSIQSIARSVESFPSVTANKNQKKQLSLDTNLYLMTLQSFLNLTSSFIVSFFCCWLGADCSKQKKEWCRRMMRIDWIRKTKSQTSFMPLLAVVSAVLILHTDISLHARTYSTTKRKSRTSFSIFFWTFALWFVLNSK